MITIDQYASSSARSAANASRMAMGPNVLDALVVGLPARVTCRVCAERLAAMGRR